MNIKQKFNSIDQSQMNAKVKDVLKKMEKASKGFTDEVVNKKIEPQLDKLIARIKDKKPSAIKTAKETAKAVKKKDYPEKKKWSSKFMDLAKKIRKEGESWQDAMKRAKKQLEDEKKKSESKVKTEIDTLKELIKTDPILKGFSGSDLQRDAVRKAKPSGKRKSQKGWKNQYGTSKGGRTYYENRENRKDRLAPNYPKNKPLLVSGGELMNENYDIQQLGVPNAEHLVMKTGGELMDENGDIQQLGIPNAEHLVMETGGRTKSALMKDRAYFNKMQEWERRYSKGKDRKGYKEKGGLVRIKIADIVKGKKFHLPNGEQIEVVRVFTDKYFPDDELVEINRTGGTHQQGKSTLRVKTLQLFLNNFGGQPFKKGGKVKDYEYIHPDNIKELSAIVKGQTKNIKGSDVLSGAYVRAKQGTETIIERIRKKILACWKDDDDFKELQKFLKDDDIDFFLNHISESLIIAFYCGVNEAYDFKGDVYGDGFQTYRLDAIQKKIDRAKEVVKKKEFEIGMKYPTDVRWSFLGKLKETKEIKGKVHTLKLSSGNKTTQQVYKIWIFEKAVYGKIIARIEDGKYDDTYFEGSKAKMDGSYASIVSSNSKTIDRTLLELAKQDGIYIKDVDVIVNNLGGVPASELKKNKVKFEKGGEIKTIGYREL